MKYTIKEDTQEGIWSSPELETDLGSAFIRQTVISGWSGSRRWAEDEHGALIYGLEPDGRTPMISITQTAAMRRVADLESQRFTAERMGAAARRRGRPRKVIKVRL